LVNFRFNIVAVIEEKWIEETLGIQDPVIIPADQPDRILSSQLQWKRALKPYGRFKVVSKSTFINSPLQSRSSPLGLASASILEPVNFTRVSSDTANRALALQRSIFSPRRQHQQEAVADMPEMQGPARNASVGRGKKGSSSAMLVPKSKSVKLYRLYKSSFLA